MKKRVFALMLALCLVFAMMPVPAFAEGEVTEPQTVVPEEGKNPEEPVVPEEGKNPEEPVVPEEGKNPEEPVIPEEGKNPEEPVVPEEGKKPEEPVVPEEGKNPEEPLTPAEPTAVQKVQALIDALPETVTAENRAEVEAQLTAIDDAKVSLGDDELAALDFGKYNGAVAAISALDGMPGAEVPETLENETKNTLIFDPNGGTLVTGVQEQIQTAEDSILIPTAQEALREDYEFVGWNTAEDGTGTSYNVMDTYDFNASNTGETVTLYAQWVKVIDRVDLSLSGHKLDEKVEGVKVTTKDDVSFPLEKYDDGWGIIQDPNKLISLSAKLFQADTQYYLWVTFSAKEGYTLKGLKKENVFLDGKAALSLKDERGTVTVVFCLPLIYTIETSTGKNGTIDPEGTVAVFEGQDVEIKITPNKGYVVYRLTVDGTNVKTARTYSFKNVQESHTIHARFLKNGSNAKTGDSFPMATALGVVTISAAALAALFFLRKKRRMG